MKLKTTLFDAADCLDTEERQAAYIAAALESSDSDFMRNTLDLVARARGMGEIAVSAGLNRESRYKALGKSGNLRIRHRKAHRSRFGAYFVGPSGRTRPQIKKTTGGLP